MNTTELQNRPLDEALIKELWSRTYKEGTPDWSHIFPLYHPDIHFQDAVQEVKGFEKFSAVCNRLAKRCRSLEMEIKNIGHWEEGFFFEWTMTLRFKIFPNSKMYGATRLTVGKEGLITHQRDYYDLWGDIYDNIPVFRRFYRWFIRRSMG